jgi:hypothetical protein
MEFVSEDQTWILRANSDLIGSKVTVELLTVVGSVAQIYKASVCFHCSTALLQAREASMVKPKGFFLSV